jgi:hypothetical protein
LQKIEEMMKNRDKSNFESSFRKENGYYLLELRLTNLDQFFETFDPSPFHKKDINDDAERYIVNSVEAFPLKSKLKLVFFLSEEHNKEASHVLIPAIENFFQFQAMMASRAIRSLLNEGKISLLLGFLFLIVCIGTGAVVSLAFHNHLRAVVLEGLSIIGWVAMWRPIQIFLYDWWALYRKKKIFEKIRDMPIEIVVE